MSVSNARPGRSRPERGSATSNTEDGAYVLPPTVSRDALLDNGSDRRFRTMVGDLLTVFARMEIVREHFGRRLGITGPQYSLIVAVARLQGAGGISVSALANALHVSSAFVASETGKLARRGFLHKRTNPIDRRGVLLSIAPAGRLKLDRISAEIRSINDVFFGALDAKTFAALSAVAGGLVESSGDVVSSLHRLKGIPQSSLRVAG